MFCCHFVIIYLIYRAFIAYLCGIIALKWRHIVQSTKEKQIDFLMATFAAPPTVITVSTTTTISSSEREDNDLVAKFFRACAQGDVELMQELMVSSDNETFQQWLHLFRQDGRTPLHMAVAANQLPMVEFLLNNGADPNICDDKVRRYGRSAFHDAITEQRAEMIPLMLAKNASVTQSDKFGKNALHIALEAEAVEDNILLVLLAQPQANVSLQDESGRTAIHTALLSLDENEAFETVVMTLLKRPEFNPLLVDVNGNTVLHLAAQQGMESVFGICLARSVPLNAQNKFGQTPLHVLVKAGYGWDEAKTLLEAPQCNLTIKDKKGLTIRDYAERYGDADLIEYFYNLSSKNTTSGNNNDSVDSNNNSTDTTFVTTK